MDCSVNRPTWVPGADSGVALKKFFEIIKVKYQIKDLAELQQWSVEHSDQFWSEAWDFFGVIGEKKFGSSIGYCAEAVAVNRVLENHPTRLKSIIVGKAIRPKTLQYGKKCKICRNMF